MYNIHYNVYYPSSNRCAMIILDHFERSTPNFPRRNQEEGRGKCLLDPAGEGWRRLLRPRLGEAPSGLDFESRPLFFLLLSLARALPSLLACTTATINTHLVCTHGRRCTRTTTTAQMCALTCQWKSSPLETKNRLTFSFPTLFFNF